jgi:polar amino acid transport system substrate-binding protein
MKNIILTFLIIFFTVTVSIAKTSIRITNGEWEPYHSEFSYEYGLISHIISESFNLEGINVKWGFFPWKRSYEIAKLGIWDASATWVPTNEREKDFWITKPILSISFVFYYLKKRKLQLEDMPGLIIGLTRGYTYGNEMETFIKENNLAVDVATSDEQNFQRLLNGRIDIFPNDPFVGYAQIRNQFSPKEVVLFTHHPKEFNKNTLNLVISKKCKNGRIFQEKFNSGFEKLKKSGGYVQMFKDLNLGKYDKQESKWQK